MSESGSSTGKSAVAGQRTKRSSAPRNLLTGLLLLCLLVWAGNFFLVGQPVSNELDSDARNSGFRLSAHYRLYVDPTTLVLNLRGVDQAAPMDLLRGLFQAARVLHASGRSFSKVILARSGRAMFVIAGSAFADLGAEVAGGQNPIYLVRTFPEKVYHLDGTPAFGSWTGGLLGVLSRQMEDVKQFAQVWARGD